MNAVEKNIDELVFKELNNANEQFPLFQSPHEGYAVIKEEIEEVMDGMNLLLEVFANAWAGIKKNEPVFEQVRAVRELAKHIATESVQVAAMCDKYNMSLAGDNADHCIYCGADVSDLGVQVCSDCKKKLGEKDGV